MNVWPPREGMSDTIAGRSTPGSILSTKCAIAMSAPVLPALTQALACPRLDEVEGAAHGGVLLAPQGLARMIVHLHHLLGEQAFDVRRLGGRDPMLELGPPADQREPDVRKFRAQPRRQPARKPKARSRRSWRRWQCEGARTRIARLLRKPQTALEPPAFGSRSILRPLPLRCPPWSSRPSGRDRNHRARSDAGNGFRRSSSRSTRREPRAPSAIGACRASTGSFCFFELP